MMKGSMRSLAGRDPLVYMVRTPVGRDQPPSVISSIRLYLTRYTCRIRDTVWQHKSTVLGPLSTWLMRSAQSVK